MLASTQNSNSVLLVLKPKSKSSTGEKVKPYFEISKKEGKEWKIVDDQTISSITGDLSKVEVVEEEWQGDKYFRVKLFLRDGDESYLVPLRLSIASRSLLNSLFSLEDFSNITIKYYQTATGYDAYFVSQNDERVAWKYDTSEIPAADEVTLGKKKIRDFTKVDSFYVEKVNELAQRLNKANSRPKSKDVEETVEEEVEF